MMSDNFRRLIWAGIVIGALVDISPAWASQQGGSNLSGGYSSGIVLGSTGRYEILDTGQFALYPTAETLRAAGAPVPYGRPWVWGMPDREGIYGIPDRTAGAGAVGEAQIHRGARGWYWITSFGELILWPAGANAAIDR